MQRFRIPSIQWGGERLLGSIIVAHLLFLLGVRPSRDGWGGHRPAEEWLFGYSKWGFP